jgi:NADP-dependent 3-hydroxy acid dehydrogenase YdfG
VRRRDDVCALVNLACDKFALPPNAIARAIAFAIEQPDDVDVNELIVRPTAQG